MLTHKKASLADAQLIQSLAHQTWPDTFGNILSTEQIDYMLDMMYSPAAIEQQMEQQHVFLILEDDENAIGYVSYQLDYLANTTKIHKLYVLPNQQGKGAGKYLIQTVADIAENEKQLRLRLDVNYQNKAIGFYQHLGFEIIDRIDTKIGNGYLMEDYVMEKLL